MCRWLAYTGSKVLLDDLLFKPAHSLIDQSLNSQMGATTTNGDGFGLGWYDDQASPLLFRSTIPAWSDRNLKELSRYVESSLVFAHIRAATGTPIQQTNCHPFRFGRWLWMHNGAIRQFHTLKRDLAFAVDPSLYPEIEGSTDTELFFYLALTFGLQDDPPAAVQQAAGFIEQVGHSHGVQHPLQMTVTTTDGDSVWAFRYSSEGASRSLFYSSDVATLRAHYPDNEVFQRLSEQSRLIVSEPLSDLAGTWNEISEASYLVVNAGDNEIIPFKPRSP